MEKIKPACLLIAETAGRHGAAPRDRSERGPIGSTANRTAGSPGGYREPAEPAGVRGPRAAGQDGRVSNSVIVVLLLAVAGFLVGGAFTMWKNSRVLSVMLGVCAVLAVVGVVTWW